MKTTASSRRIRLGAFALAALLGHLSLHAADVEDRNRFHVGGRFTFNISAEVRNLPVAPSLGPDYDDGFIREDISRNANTTWNWAYGFTNQIVGPAGNRSLELHGAASPRDNTRESLPDDMQFGFEIGYGRELLQLAVKEWSHIGIGLEASFGSSALNIRGTRTISGTVTRTTDTYSLGSTIPPLPPYSGTVDGPGPLIDRARTGRRTSTETATSTQTAEIEGVYYGFRFGPFAEIPLGRRFSMTLAGGAALIHADAEFGYAETFTVTGTGGPPQPRIARDSSTDWLFGGYGEAKLTFWFNEVTGVYVGGQYHFLEDFELRTGSREATVNFGENFSVTAGLTFAF